MSPRAKERTQRPRIVRCDPLELPADQERAPLWRAELHFHGVDLTGPTYRAAVFFNRPRLTHDTLEDADHGYAGAFFIFGKGGCFGDEGHCDVRVPQDRFDHDPPAQSSPTFRLVDVTAALRRELAAGSSSVVVSLRPTLADTAGVKIDGDLLNPIKFEQVGLVTYDAYAPAATRHVKP